MNAKLQTILDQHADFCGIKVVRLEVKLPQEKQWAISKQAEAEREKRAKIIHAAGEFEAAAKLASWPSRSLWPSNSGTFKP